MPYPPATPCAKCGRLYAGRRTLREHESGCRGTVAQVQACQRGEHLYVTGRRTCPFCGAEL